MQQAVYIGAGHDIIPVLVFRDIKKFIFIDSQPFSEHGTSVYTKEYISYETTLETREQYEADNLFGRPKFIEDYKELMIQNNFILQSESKYCITYKNEYDQIIKYHLSCSFPEFLTDEIKSDILECNTLILCGYFPNKQVLSMMKEPKFLIGNCHTVYTFNQEDASEASEAVTRYLLEHPYMIENYLLLKEDKEYEYWNHDNIIPSIRDNYTIIKCNDLDEMEYIRKNCFKNFFII
jgi:hypothetical protein